MANLSKLDIVIKDGYANVTANMKLLNSVIVMLPVSKLLQFAFGVTKLNQLIRSCTYASWCVICWIIMLKAQLCTI